MRSAYLMLINILTWPLNESTTIYKEVLVNVTTNISCIPNEDIHIQWHHTPPGGSKSDYVYAGGKFYSSSNRGFRLEKDSNTGPYHLVIPSARSEDAGLYECKEDATGSRVFGSTQLTVLESNPVCGSDMKPNGYVGQTTCQLKQEVMTFTCAVSFKGEPPQMTWKILNDSRPFNEASCKIENGRITCSLIIEKPESKYDGTIFNCHTSNSSVNCSSEIIKIQYFEGEKQLVKKNINDKVICAVKSNQILKFNWTRLDGHQYVPITENQELLIPKSGYYRCIVEYRIKNVQCSSEVANVNVYSPDTVTCETPKAGTEPVSTAVISVLAIFAAIFFVAIIFLLRKTNTFKKCRNAMNRTNNKESRPFNPNGNNTVAVEVA